MKVLHRIGLVSLLLMAFALFPVSAHEGREVGDYEIELGWQIEPAYTGQVNELEIDIVVAKTTEGVAGAEETLQAEVTFGPAKKILKLEPDPDNAGHYSTRLIPTRPGDYTFRLFGKINDTSVDESFSAAEGQFSTVEPVSDLQFPDAEISLADLQTQITALQAQIAVLQSTPAP